MLMEKENKAFNQFKDLPILFVNSYENEAGEIILDFCRYDRLFDFENPLPMGHKPFLTRWVIDIEQKTCKEKNHYFSNEWN